ncbi:DUF393 domain-containing protein [Vibrio scophthalmi]|uniref:Uncharacterized protein n=1 Tax=Vibrio scophthalmi TaxID=45658 RepID=A0A1B1NPZ1_9VIBR|nr:DUF393 domain-containing protein [Vibrio scophthalmi]ANS85748.1 hypothetical protein VSVS12_01982 [Vibrio scophthalmi]ANU36112.1 hypothetical protein VSVS05_00985 [Vibrio scophthalmi]
MHNLKQPVSAVAIFYDASCPLCVKEMSSLKTHLGDNVTFVNVQNEIMMEHYPTVEQSECLRVLHVIDQSGQLRLGVDANIYLWELAGKKPILRILRWPILRSIARGGYWLFARYRYQLSYLLTGQTRCKQCEL